MTGDASRKPRWPRSFSAVGRIYSPEHVAKLGFVGTMKVMVAKEDNSHHPGVLQPHLHTSGLGSLACVFFAGNGASGNRRHVELTMTCTALRNRNQGSGMQRRLHGLRAKTITTQPKHPTRTNFNPRPTVSNTYKRRFWRRPRGKTC